MTAAEGLTRRGWLASALGAFCALPGFGQEKAPRRFRIGACDWSLGKMANLEALDVARQIGLDGVQVSFGAEGMRLKAPDLQRRYREAARAQGVALASLALPELNNIPFKSDPRTVEWVAGAIEACRDLELKVILLAFFHKNDLKKDAAGTAETVRRLRELAPAAEKAGVVLGVESWLDAGEHLDLLQRVGSKAVRVYYDVANAEKMGYDVPAEIRRLGAEHICEFHAKENASLLGEGRVDFRKVREAMEDIGYRGWIQIEGAMGKGLGLVESYTRNLKFLRGLYPAD